MPPLSALVSTANGVKSDDLMEFLRVSEWGKREYRVWRDCSRHYAERRGYYAVNRQAWPAALCVSNTLLGGYISEQVPQTVNIAHARMCQNRYMPEARVSDPMASQDDLFAEGAANQFLLDHWDRNHSQCRRDWIARNLLIEGDDFLGLRFDPEQVGTVKMTASLLTAYEMSGKRPIQVTPIGENFAGEPQFRCEIHAGGTVEYRVPSSMVFVQDGISNWEEATRFAILSYPDVHIARAQWANAPGADNIEALNIQDLKGAGTIGYLGSGQDYMRWDTQTDPVGAGMQRNRTCIGEFWIKEGPYWRRIVRTGYNFSKEVEDTSGLLMNPFVHYRYARTGDFWSQGLVQGMITSAYSLNMRLTQLSGYVARSLKTAYMVPMGSKLALVSNDYNTIIQYDSTGAPPQRLPADQATLAVFQACIEYDTAFLNIGGQLGDAGLGDVPARTSAAVLRSTQAAVYGALELAASNMRDTDRECAKKILMINQRMSDWPRMAKIFGNGGELMARSFQGTDIASGTNITVSTTNSSPEAARDRAEQFIQLAPFVANPGIIKQFLDYRDGKNLDALRPIEVRYSEAEANNEFALINSGKVFQLPSEIVFNMDRGKIAEMGLRPTYLGYMAPGPNGQPEPRALLQEGQDDNVHVEQHMLQARDPNTPFPVRQLLMYHVQAEHQPRIQIARQQAEFEQAMMMRKFSIAESAGQQATAIVQGEVQKQVVQIGAEAKAENGQKPGHSSAESRSVSAPATAAAGGRR